MKGILNWTKALKHNKKFVSFLQLALLGVILFVTFDEVLINGIRYLLEVLNVKNADKVLADGFLIYKALFNYSQLYTIIDVTIKVLLSCIAFVAFIFLFFRVVEKLFIKKQSCNYSNEAITTANYAAFYITQSKFLC